MEINTIYLTKINQTYFGDIFYNLDLTKFRLIASYPGQNQDLTFEKRLHRRNALKLHLEHLGYKLGIDSAEHMLKILKEHVPTFEKRLQLKKMLKIKSAK